MTGKVDVFAIVLNWPDNGTLILGCPITSSSTQVTLLGVESPLHVSFPFYRKRFMFIIFLFPVLIILD